MTGGVSLDAKNAKKAVSGGNFTLSADNKRLEYVLIVKDLDDVPALLR
jgi:hypothetical protein